MILIQFLIATAALSAALTVMAWAADRGEPTGLTYDIDGCDDEPTVVVTSMTSGNRRFACERCAEELTARDAWRSR